jgi:hypothetical protein
LPRVGTQEGDSSMPLHCPHAKDAFYKSTNPKYGLSPFSKKKKKKKKRSMKKSESEQLSLRQGDMQQWIWFLRMSCGSIEVKIILDVSRRYVIVNHTTLLAGFSNFAL